MRAGMAATNPTRPATAPSLALASTSSPSWRTTVGTSALLATAYDRPSTRATKASGNSKRLSSLKAINRLTTTRPDATATTIIRRPPLIRSMAGPRKGATMAKGATVKSR